MHAFGGLSCQYHALLFPMPFLKVTSDSRGYDLNKG
jgi:hypothetical protein